MPEYFPAKQMPVRVKKIRHLKTLEHFLRQSKREMLQHLWKSR